MDDIVLDFRRELTFSVGSDTCQGELKIPKIVYLPERKKWGCHWSITFIVLLRQGCVTGLRLGR